MAVDLSHVDGRYVLCMASFPTFQSPRIFRIASWIARLPVTAASALAIPDATR